MIIRRKYKLLRVDYRSVNENAKESMQRHKAVIPKLSDSYILSEIQQGFLPQNIHFCTQCLGDKS